MAIDATPGGSSADSYLDVTDADTYFSNRLYDTEWTSATTDQKERALKWATKILEKKPWIGGKAYSDGSLRWPRTDVYDLDGVALSSTVIPDWLEEATAELALQLLIENRTTDPDTAGFKRIKADVIELEVDKYDNKDVIPEFVYSIIDPYIHAEGITLSRT